MIISPTHDILSTQDLMSYIQCIMQNKSLAQDIMLHERAGRKCVFEIIYHHNIMSDINSRKKYSLKSCTVVQLY